MERGTLKVNYFDTKHQLDEDERLTEGTETKTLHLLHEAIGTKLTAFMQ